MGRWFSVEFEQSNRDGPPDRVRHVGTDAGDPAAFATALAGAILAGRAAERVWGNGEEFGSDDILLMASHLLLTMAGHELAPGGMWHFESDDQAEREGYGPALAKLSELLAAASAFVSAACIARGGAPTTSHSEAP